MCRLTPRPFRTISVPPWASFRHGFPALSPLYMLFSLPQMPVFLSAGWVLTLPPLDFTLLLLIYSSGHSLSPVRPSLS